MKKYEYGTGRRKSAIVQVRLEKGNGEISNVKGKHLSPGVIEQINELLDKISKKGAYNISLLLKGGGKKSQEEATKLAVARALIKLDNEHEKVLKKEGYLTRDPREKERKKPGLKGARRAPQWQKR